MNDFNINVEHPFFKQIFYFQTVHDMRCKMLISLLLLPVPATLLTVLQFESMSSVSSAHLQSQDSLLSVDIVTQSYQFTPVMELDGASDSSSGLQPRVLQFAEQIHNNLRKQSIELLICSRIYESFEFNQDSAHRHSPKQLQNHSLRTEELFPDSSQKGSSCQNQLESLPEKLPSNSSGKIRKDSVGYFCEQLAELKKNVSKLITVINSRNPEEGRSRGQGCVAPHSSFELAVNNKQSLDAKSTESQQMKDQSLHIDRPITHFQSPDKRLESSLQDVSPIMHRTADLCHHSNVSDCSTRNLMRRKMKNNFELSSNSA